MRRLGGAVVLVFVSLAAGRAIAEPTAPPKQTDPATRPILFLDRGLGWGFDVGPRFDYSQLLREYLRQAVLLAAREELGWQTRDAWLGERTAAGDGVLTMDIVAQPGKPPTVDVLTGAAPRQRRRATIVIPDEVARVDGSEIAVFERLSREQFPEIIRKATGAAMVRAPRWSNAELPTDAEAQLQKLTFYSQFAGVRSIHAAVAAGGESPALVGGLVRGYANLGLLTEGLWNPSFRSFHARALLYAQRWHAREPNSQAAIWHLAYAKAAAGLHWLAIDDLAAAEKLQASEKQRAAPASGEEPPAWLPLVRAYVNFDLAPLKAVQDGPQKELANLLLLLAYQQAESKDLAIRLAGKSLAEMPDCPRIHEDLARLAGISLLHRTTVATPATFAKTLYRNVAALEGCPDDALEIALPRRQQNQLLEGDEALSEQRDRLKLIAALYHMGAAALAGKTGAEPGWDALAYWIEETTFSHIFRRGRFLGRNLGVDPDDYLKDIAPLIEKHRYRCVIESFSFDPDVRRKAMEQIKSMSLYGLDSRQAYLIELFFNHDRDQADKISIDLEQQLDDTANDYYVVAVTFEHTDRVPTAEKLLRCSPKSPLALSILIENRWEKYKGRAAEYEKIAENHPRLARALGRKYAKEREFAKAEKLFKISVALDPSFASYSALGDMYGDQGDLDKYEQTYKEYLEKVPDFGLDHAQAANAVAWTFIRHDKWDRARPFAERAAQSGAGWALPTLAIVAEHEGNYRLANDIYSGVVERYGSSESFTWFCFCRRTGQGDEKGARKAFEEFRASTREPTANENFSFGMADLLDDKEESALGQFRKSFDQTPHPIHGLAAALAADRLGQRELRDQLLQAVGKRGPEFKDSANNQPIQNLIELAGLLADDLKREQSALDLQEAEKLCKKGYALQMHMAACLVGEYLAQHGKLDDAKRFWLRAVEEPEVNHYFFEIAAYKLRKAGIKPENVDSAREKLGMKDRWLVE